MVKAENMLKSWKSDDNRIKISRFDMLLLIRKLTVAIESSWYSIELLSSIISKNKQTYSSVSIPSFLKYFSYPDGPGWHRTLQETWMSFWLLLTDGKGSGPQPLTFIPDVMEWNNRPINCSKGAVERIGGGPCPTLLPVIFKSLTS